MILLARIQINLENDFVVVVVRQFASTTLDKLFLFLVQPNDDPDCCATLDVEPCVIAQVGFSNRF